MLFRSCSRIACWLVAFGTLAASAPESLREAASNSEVLVGTAVRPYALSDPAYSATLSHEFNMVEPEDSMKWWVVRATPGKFDFAETDRIVHFAIAHGMKVFWDHTNPKWLTGGHFSPDQLSHLLQEHIATEMKHYAGQVFAWHVVNEALDEKGKPRDAIWYNTPGIGLSDQGTAYIEQAFRWAHDADPNALLFYNEAEGEGLSGKSDAIYAMLKDFKTRRVPIDGIGLQLHVPRLDFDSDAVAKNIARLAKLGVQVHITELDVALPVDANGEPQKQDLLRQAEVYAAVVRACLQSAGCTAIQTWGFTDKYPWIGSHAHGTLGAALLFDRDYKPKPAYNSILKELTLGRPATQ